MHTAIAQAAQAGRIELGGEVAVNRLGLGAMRITGAGILGEPRDPEEARRLLRRAVELGVDLIDTAHAYRPEVSERLIGNVAAASLRLTEQEYERLSRRSP
jgi:pyridoxine 4-dehydrogenase